MIAHVAGMPLEELLTMLAGTGGALAFARVWVSLRLRRLRRR